MSSPLYTLFAIGLVMGVGAAMAQAPAAQPVPAASSAPVPGQRPPNPTRDPHTPGYVLAKELPDGAVPLRTPTGISSSGQRILRARKWIRTVCQGESRRVHDELGRQQDLSGDCARREHLRHADPNDPAKLIVTTSHPAPYTRHVAVYVPKRYVAGTEAPFIVGADGPDRTWPTLLDNLIAEHKLPVMIGFQLATAAEMRRAASGAWSTTPCPGRYAEFVESEVLPLVESEAHVKLTQRSGWARDDGRKLGRIVRADHGVVSPGVVSPRADLFRDICESAVAEQSGDAAWRVGVS